MMKPLLAPDTAATRRAKIVDAEQRSSFWLAQANYHRERGNVISAENAERKAQYWLDRLNKLEGLE